MNKNFFAVIVVVIGMLGGVFWFTNKNQAPAPSALGTEHSDQGREHIANGAPHAPYNSDLPSSGPHYTQPAPWGAYEQEIEPETYIHNLEHGGVVVAYRPDLSPDQIAKLKNLLSTPFSRKGFSPTKVLLFPNSSISKPIQLASWRRTFELNNYDEELIVQFYLTSVGKSPEPTAP